MSLLLKNIEELKALGQTFEFKPGAKYLILIGQLLSPEEMRAAKIVLLENGIDANIFCGIDPSTFKMFELEHQA